MSVSGIVNDYLTPLAGYPHVRDNVTLREVYATLKQHYDSAEQFRSVLVLDAGDRLVGVLGFRELLHALLPEYLKPHDPAHYEGGRGADLAALASLAPLWQEDCASQCRKAAAMPVGAHVIEAKATVAGTDPLVKAIYLFATLNANILPVVEGERIVGVLRRVDVMAAVAEAVLAEGGKP
ncbi:MAG: CBS domain-containing protein [Rhodocyclaceae bacterium]|nr:CBS domain-containing protein [Rhodocyclaceae bacterium]